MRATSATPLTNPPAGRGLAGRQVVDDRGARAGARFDLRDAGCEPACVRADRRRHLLAFLRRGRLRAAKPPSATYNWPSGPNFSPRGFSRPLATTTKGRLGAACAGEEPGALPLLSHALLETWQRRRGRLLTLAGYAAAGGVHGAIAQSAESVFMHRWTRAQQPLARRIFVELTELGEGTQDTRRRVSIADLARGPDEEPAIRAVLQVLAEARLVTLDEQTAEVAHEALIREWPTLSDWLNQDREGLRLRRQLGAAAHEWQRNGRDAGLLYRGVRLEQALEWAGEHPGELTSLERAYLDASRELCFVGHGPPLVVQPRSGVTDVAFSPDRTRLATSGGDGTGRLGLSPRAMRCRSARAGWASGVVSSRWPSARTGRGWR